MAQVEAPPLCPKCGGLTDGWKCATGSIAREHDEHHLHAGWIGTARFDALRASRPTCTAPASDSSS